MREELMLKLASAQEVFYILCVCVCMFITAENDD